MSGAKIHGSRELFKSLIAMFLQIMMGLVMWNSAVGFAQPRPKPGNTEFDHCGCRLGTAYSGAGRTARRGGTRLCGRRMPYLWVATATPLGRPLRGLRWNRRWPCSRKKLKTLIPKQPQFYSVGNSEISLPPGRYELKVYKGIEYEVQRHEIQMRAGETVELTVKMSRWIEMTQQGWYSADDHLHIPRPVKELDPFISKQMQAEDLRVANLLQIGLSKRFHTAIQYTHGPASIYREGDYWVVAGQENPRTHFLGHTITLGAHSPINFPEAYVLYRLFWEEARRQGALSGYAHYGKLRGALFGLALDLPGGLLSFLEVLQFRQAIYDVWYDILNTGFRLTPTAGTDYGCGNHTNPGRERFYTKVEGPLTYNAWLEGVRRGRTFVTNGPLLEFRVNGKGIGGEVVLKERGSVLVEGSVHFDPTRG